MAEEPKLAMDGEWSGSIHGIQLYVNRNLSPGTVQFRDAKGNVIGIIINVSDLHVGPRSTV